MNENINYINILADLTQALQVLDSGCSPIVRLFARVSNNNPITSLSGGGARPPGRVDSNSRGGCYDYQDL